MNSLEKTDPSLSLSIRPSTVEDLPILLALYEEARQFMRDTGNPTQWGETHPRKELLSEDLQTSRSYVCLTDSGEIVGTFAFWIGSDPMYSYIEGEWPDTGEYGVVHRIATRRNTHGVGRYCLEWALNQCRQLRIDTHQNNAPMLHLLHKLGFTECGIVYTPEPDHSPRIAFCKLR